MQRFITSLFSKVLVVGLVFSTSLVGMTPVYADYDGNGTPTVEETQDLVEEIQETLQHLKDAGIDTAAFEARLVKPGEDLTVLLHDVHVLWTQVELKLRIQELIVKLDKLGIVTTSYTTRLNTPGENLSTLLSEVRTLWKSTQLATALRTGISQLIKQLERYGVDTAAFKTRLTKPGEDLKVLKNDVKKALALAKAQKRVLHDIQDLIAKLDKFGVNTTAYVTRLNTPNEDLAKLKADLKVAVKDFLKSQEHKGPKNKD